MIDFFNQSLEIGDSVAVMVPKYRELVLGKIYKFTPQQVKVAYNAFNTFKHGEPVYVDSSGNKYYDSIIQYPNAVIKKL